MLDPSARRQRARIAALVMHSKGLTNTAPARAAFRNHFERDVDPDGTLTPEERAKRAEFARRAFYSRLAFASAKARRARSRNKKAISASTTLTAKEGPDGTRDLSAAA